MSRMTSPSKIPLLIAIFFVVWLILLVPCLLQRKQYENNGQHVQATVQELSYETLRNGYRMTYLDSGGLEQSTMLPGLHLLSTLQPGDTADVLVIPGRPYAQFADRMDFWLSRRELKLLLLPLVLYLTYWLLRRFRQRPPKEVAAGS
jgi:hypothetical protein